MGHRHKRVSDPFVNPDLPIVPMLDMSFQLMAFFLIVFNPVAPEGHLDLALPKQTGGANAVPSFEQQEEDELTVQIEAQDAGGVAAIKVLPKGATEPVPLGVDSEALFAFLQKRAKEKGAGKLRLEMGDALEYTFVVKLLDECTRAGYRQVSPAALGSGDKK